MKAKWSWKTWLAAVKSCNHLNDRDRAIAAAVHLASRGRGRSRRWIAPWEVNEGDCQYSDLSRLECLGFLHRAPGNGVYYPTLDPLPSRGSIPLTRPEKRLIRLILGGACLWYERRADYFAPRRHKEPWRLHVDTFTSTQVRFRPSDVDSLGRKGLLYNNGCVAGGWRDPSCMKFDVDRIRLIGTRAFQHIGEEVLSDRFKRTKLVKDERTEGT